ncbi:glycosyl transferase family 1 [Arthrobacter sp. Soil736]|uniref:glycosyltransferase n=1 Tax=Arthrobacter sp. Soil736 TaxID=1736395 RepID=UPI0006F3DA57|nr:glycosyltransferase [Arthrobacter sp. Soil736]KRE53087.1 glycosyl transferase family 1 [Arthrobacter sp. Soil736]
MESPLPAVRLLVPGNILHNSGGNVYNASLVQGLRRLGVSAAIESVDGAWPVGSSEERRRLAGLLGPGTVTGNAVTIVDGLVASGAPEALEAVETSAGRPWILLHMPLIDHPELEIRALRAAAGVICTSGSVAAEITRRHGATNVHVALPGTDPAEPAAGSEPPHLLSVAALLPNKDQLLLLGALALLADLPWTAALVGSDEADPDYARRVKAAVEDYGLGSRVRVGGELTGADLEQAWQAADLSLLISRVEAFGMVVTESLAHGVPAVVRSGTGAVEALAVGSDPHAAGEPALPGDAVGLDTDPAPLAAVLRNWLTRPDVRAEWRRAALAARERLPGWDSTARLVLGIVAGGSPDARHSSEGDAGGQ